MSKGLGRAQALILRAMMSLEAEHHRQDRYTARRLGVRFYVWAIIERAWEMSPELRHREAEDAAAWLEYQEARDAEMKALAESGNKLAREYLMLGRSLRYYYAGRRRPRQRRKFPAFVEEHMNPSRALASLARRGLIHRYAVGGGGSAGLTEAGRDAGRREIMRRLSVGTSLRHAQEVASNAA